MTPEDIAAMAEGRSRKRMMIEDIGLGVFCASVVTLFGGPQWAGFLGFVAGVAWSIAYDIRRAIVQHLQERKHD